MSASATCSATCADSTVVDRHVRNLRLKLQNDYRQPRFIATVPGGGHRFIPTLANVGRDSESTESTAHERPSH